MNAVYRSGDLLVRVGRVNGAPSAAVQLAETLLSHGIRAARPADLVPYDSGDGFAATAWEYVVASEAPIAWAQVGAMVAGVHGLAPDDIPGRHPLPWCGDFPWWDVDALMAEVSPDLDAAAAAGLRSAVGRHRHWAEVDAQVVVCHGDVHDQNVIMADDGPVLIDWDLLCRGPAAWDHAGPARFGDRWGGEPDAYQEFARGYGISLAGTSVVDDLAEMRLIVATLMMVRRARTDPAAARESRRRLRYWRGEPAAPAWHAM
ncbi:MAG: aminoglycoside phosphotransferase family protein [Actinomycetota bacterium]|nr:aminoglycoside phosphotransferase family protein [Actinomycetota bacterium]